MSRQLFSKNKTFRALNIVDSSLTTLRAKGNLGYANELYNPRNFFEEVHHISFYPEDFKIKLENKTIKIHVLKKGASRPLWHPANVLFFVLQIIKITIKNRISIIRGRSIGLAGFLGLLTGKMLGVPLIVSLGGDNRLDRELTFRFENGLTYMKALKKTFADVVEIFILRNADCIIVPNAYTKNYGISMKANEKRIKIVGFTLKRDIFERKADRDELDRFVKKFDLDLKKPIVLYVGRLHAYKQVEVIMESVPYIVKEKPDTQFVFIGDGPLRERLERKAETLNVAEKVYFLGFQPTNVVKAFLSISSVVWIPMSGFVVFEAAAFGAPIVAFDIEWHHEFISNEINGLLVENRNFKEMAGAVIKMLENPELARKFGESARDKLAKEYNPQTLNEKEIEIYKSILNTTRAND